MEIDMMWEYGMGWGWGWFGMILFWLVVRCSRLRGRYASLDHRRRNSMKKIVLAGLTVAVP